MKRILLLLLLTVCVWQLSHAQMYIGLSAGPSFTTFKLSSSPMSSLKTHVQPKINIAIPVLFKLNKNIAFQTGISYLNMGSKITVDRSKYFVIDAEDPVFASVIKTDIRYKLHYISIPLTVNVSIPIHSYSVYAKAGGYFSYMISGKTYDKQYNTKESIDYSKKQMSRVDAGILLGAGAAKELGRGSIFIDFTYMIGCANIQSSNNFFNSFGYKAVYNKGLVFSAGYMFPLSKK